MIKEKVFRTVLFCLYQINGRLSCDIEHLLCDLRRNCDYLAIIINGNFFDTEKLGTYANKIIERENKGFDGGAFKVGLNDAEIHTVIKKSDELVLCNDTFYGPFVPFADIFKKLENSPADFWGIRFADNGLTQMLQSFFLVFRKSIIQSLVLEDFFEMYPENSENFNDALIFYERNIFCYLKEKGFNHDFFYKLKYKFLDADVICGKSPVVKKKHAFDPNFGLYNKDIVLRILRFINENYNYDVNLIIDDIKTRYGVDLKDVDLKDVDLKGVDTAPANLRGVIKAFADKYPKIYVYGLGFWARNIITVIGLKKIAAFVISDNKIPEGCYGNKMVYRVSQIKDKSVPMIIAANRKNTAEILPLLSGFSNVLNMW